VNSRIFGVAFGVIVVALPAAGQEQGDPAAGYELASKLCTTCHIVGTERTGSDVAPPFPALAQNPDIALTELHAWRSGPMHPILSNLALTPKQIADINAYLDSLRGETAEPPRVETEEPPPALEGAPPEKLGEPIEVQPE
jgi:mono/diheme cytochrome c family protein